MARSERPHIAEVIAITSCAWRRMEVRATGVCRWTDQEELMEFPFPEGEALAHCT
jgi:hypothetical protein